MRFHKENSKTSRCEDLYFTPAKGQTWGLCLRNVEFKPESIVQLFNVMSRLRSRLDMSFSQAEIDWVICKTCMNLQQIQPLSLLYLPTGGKIDNICVTGAVIKAAHFVESEWVGGLIYFSHENLSQSLDSSYQLDL